MSKIREKLKALSKKCERMCKKEGHVGTDRGIPNFHLLYSGIESYECGNGYVIFGKNPAGDSTHADKANQDRPFREPLYSAYLDDEWDGNPRGQSDLQRVVQGLAMVLTGANPTDAISAIKNLNMVPEDRVGAKAEALLRNAPSGNIIPFRGSNLNRDVPHQLHNPGLRIGWRLLRLVRPRSESEYCLTGPAGKPQSWASTIPAGCRWCLTDAHRMTRRFQPISGHPARSGRWGTLVHAGAGRPNRNSLSRLWPVQIINHSRFAFSSPRSRNCRKPRPCFTCPNTGSTVFIRSA